MVKDKQFGRFATNTFEFRLVAVACLRHRVTVANGPKAINNKNEKQKRKGIYAHDLPRFSDRGDDGTG